ncbi:MAG: hypothetical protein IPM93_26415 [Candidatus Obscuribacter sp.]|nr:hypothetical protein [Candidatus Obscuribacter sp.]
MNKRTGALELLMLTGCLAGFTGIEAALAQGGTLSPQQGQQTGTQDRNFNTERSACTPVATGMPNTIWRFTQNGCRQTGRPSITWPYAD